MNTIAKESAVPVYQQVAEWIRDKIYTGEWQTGDKIPSEKQIMDLLEVSRGTIKKAITGLVNEGLLSSVQGKGTFVKSESDNISYSLGSGLLSFAESLENQHLKYETQVIESRVESANKLTADKLKIAIGSPIFYLKRLRSVENEKVMLIENRINMNLCPGIIDIDFNGNNLFPTIERLSKKEIGYSESRYAARIIGNERGHYLEVHEDAPVLHLEQLVHFEDGSPIEFGNVWLKSNKYYLGTILQRKVRE
jgi:DNA-binding GntR family transcriptional regulator